MLGNEPSGEPAPKGVFAHLTPWKARPFAEVALGDPDLAACYLLSPGLWSTAKPPSKPFDEAGIVSALGAQLQGLVAADAVPPLSITIAETEGAAIDAVVHGGSAVVLVPRSETPGAEEIARTLAPVILAASIGPAPPDQRCGEPLLAVAEALADSGSLALAALPPTLRPVRDWLEPRDAAAALDTCLSEALDNERHWQNRRAAIARLRQVGGASPQLGAATALLVETFGDAPRARRSPFDFLLAWQKASGKAYPALPRALKNALAAPLEAGLPKEKQKDQTSREDRDEARRDARARLVATGAATIADVAPTANTQIRLEVAARLRAKGEPDLCKWLAAGSLPPVRTGCRVDGEESGFVFSRPKGPGFEVVWKPAVGEEAVLLVWPRWVLFPAVVPANGDLWFVDPGGVWRVALDGRTPPRLASAGSFRYLTVAPDGAAVACARWPEGGVVVIQGAATHELAVNGRGGIAWLGADTLVASDGERLSLASLQGETRPDVFALPCCRALASTPAGILAGLSPPCDAGLVRVALTERSTAPLLKLPEAPLGVTSLPAGGLVLGLAEGLLIWRGEGAAERVGSGLTPGPG
ncbi:MAG TPA: hypothetical protein VMT19_08960 [Thermoanaerobaculaceae bacterium]|nr:hypothetical protein [Thermoanaerobaculaceae bacterium]